MDPIHTLQTTPKDDSKTTYKSRGHKGKKVEKQCTYILKIGSFVTVFRESFGKIRFDKTN